MSLKDFGEDYKEMDSPYEILEDMKRLMMKRTESFIAAMATLQITKELMVDIRSDTIPNNVKKRIDSLIRIIEETIRDIKEGKNLFKEL